MDKKERMKSPWHGKVHHKWDPDKLKEKLGLSEEEVAELKRLEERKAELRRRYKEAKEKGDNEAIEEVKAQKEELWKQIKGILKKPCEGREAKAHWAAKGFHGRGWRHPKWDADKLKEKFDLTDEEVAEVQRLRKKIKDILKKKA